jgi:hypothetical protein
MGLRPIASPGAARWAVSERVHVPALCLTPERDAVRVADVRDALNRAGNTGDHS